MDGDSKILRASDYESVAVQASSRAFAACDNRLQIAVMRADRAALVALVKELAESVHDLHHELCKYHAYGEVPADSSEGRRLAVAVAVVARAGAVQL